MAESEAKKSKGDGHKDVNIGIEDFSSTMHLPSLGAIHAGIENKITSDTAIDGLKFVFKGGDAFRGTTIYLLDADLGVNIPKSVWNTSSVSGFTLTTSDNQALAYQSGAPLFDMASPNADDEKKLQDALSNLENTDLNKILQVFGQNIKPESESNSINKEFDFDSFIKTMKNPDFGGVTDVGKTAVHFFDKYNRGEDGAIIFADGNEENSAGIIAFSSETDSPNWNTYIANKTDDGYRVITGTYSQSNGEVVANTIALNISDKESGASISHPKTHQPVFITNIDVTTNNQVQSIDLTKNVDSDIISQAGKAFSQSVHNAEVVLEDNNTSQNLQLAVKRMKNATNGVDIVGSQDDEIMLPGEFIDLKNNILDNKSSNKDSWYDL